MSENISLLSFLHKHIIQYVFNLYVDYQNDVPKLENIIKLKFDIKPHLKITKITSIIKSIHVYDTEDILEVTTYLDDFMIKKEQYYSNAMKKEEVNYMNGKYHGQYVNWYEDGTVKLFTTYENGKLEGDHITYNRKGIVIYKNGKDV
jgi:antitoxin component YwqK of YwqJK toxin-antitoxin module